MTISDATFESKRYDIERLMIGTSWLGEARVIRVSKRRQVERGMDQGAEIALRKWARRQVRRMAAEWHPIGDVEISYSEDQSDLFIRNQGAYRIDQRAVRIDDDWRAAWVDGKAPSFDTTADAVEIAILRGELPKPPPGCSCDCCEH